MIVCGIVKWFNDNKGYGFITSDDGVEIFVHYTQIQTNGRKTLHEGQKVSFEIKEACNRTQAENVTVVE